SAWLHDAHVAANGRAALAIPVCREYPRRRGVLGGRKQFSDTKGAQMKALFLTVGALTAAAALTVGLTGASASSRSAKARTTVSVGSSGLGKILVDGRGRTLYLFAKDARGRSTCAGACAAGWPPLIANGKPLAARGAKASLLGTTRRADGRLQVTYK